MNGSVLTKRILLEDNKQSINWGVTIFLGVMNVLLLAGIIFFEIMFSDEGLFRNMFSWFLLFFFVGNTLAMIYENTYKKNIFAKINGDRYAVTKCRMVNQLLHVDTSGETVTTTQYFEFEYDGGARKFTWSAIHASGCCDIIGVEYYVLMVINRNNIYRPVHFYLADSECGFSAIGDDIIYTDGPIKLNNRFMYPRH